MNKYSKLQLIVIDEQMYFVYNGCMKQFKKVYIEITNSCNLNCSFCVSKNNKKEFLTIKQFKIILEKIKPYTDYLYLHVTGEPLLHPNINEMINIASENFNINITTNGRLLNRIKDNKNIRQINISLQSLENPETLKNELSDILFNTENFTDTKISYRLWIKNETCDKIIQIVNNYYSCEIDMANKNFKIKDRVFINFENEFIWPSLDNKETFMHGRCLGLKDQIAILVDGTIVPCCLDEAGIINLGNIFESDLKSILESKRVQNIVNGFKNNRKVEKLCQKCNFYELRKQNNDKITNAKECVKNG